MLQCPGSPRSEPRNTLVNMTVSNRSVLKTAMFSRHRDARRMGHVGLHAPGAQPARKPEAVPTCLIGDDKPIGRPPTRGLIGAWLRRLFLLACPALLLTPAPAAAAGCFAAMAEAPPLRLSALAADAASAVGLTFLGHASFLIESPAGVTIVTDYNGFNRPNLTPDIVTMNHAHPLHYTDRVDPGVKFVLRGWDTGGGIAHHDVKYRDVRVRNVPTNIRDTGGTEFGGNSIFVFETADLCIAHLSHLHHTLTPEHLAALGQVDVLLAPVDGAYTLSHEDMLAVIDQIKPPLVIPMHYFGPDVLRRFLARANGRYPVRFNPTPQVSLTRDTLPKATEILVLPGD